MKNWSLVKERKGGRGILFFLSVYRLLGRRIFRLILFPVIFCYWMTGKKQREASQKYLKNLKKYAALKEVKVHQSINSFWHFMSFGEMMLDKLTSWSGQLTIKDLDFPELQAYLDEDSLNEGSMIICSHVGNIELCRALAELEVTKTVNALVFTEHAQKFNQIMQLVNPDSNVNLIEVNTLTPEVIILLKQRMDAGEWVAIVGDRTPISNYYREEDAPVIWSTFLGEKAPFPRGPFVLASVLKCPVYTMTALRHNDRYTVYFAKLPIETDRNKANREVLLQQGVDCYASRLEFYCLKSPLEWFNFYDFWKLPSNIAQEKQSSKERV